MTGSYYKVLQVLQTLAGITKCYRKLLKSLTGITKSDKKLFQSVIGIAKCDNYYKVRRKFGLLKGKLVDCC